MEFMYQPTELELKLSVLYVIKHLKTKATGPLLHNIIGSVVKTNFFEIGHIVYLLIESKNLTEMMIDNETAYIITNEGEASVGYFYKDIPYSVREKLLNAVDKINKQIKFESEIIADIEPASYKSFMTKCEINEGGEKLLGLELNVGTREMAKKCSEYFKEHYEEIYTKIVTIMCSEIKD
ncbi:MAG: DUF4364 family protein [Ruminococcaceae bacterium]|nr:DUF4364 family protein [Oscillospiraceae bacterium]